MRRSKLRVAIVGGGIGGMSLALALLQRGVEVKVFEQATALGEIGAGVQLTPNSLRLLNRLGLGLALDKVGVPFGADSHYYRMDGTPVGPVLTTDSSGWNAVYGMHRADMLTILANALPPRTVATDRRCIGFSQTAGEARIEFADGSVAVADVVIGADGIHSIMREHVTEPSLPVHSGSLAYRGLIPASEVPFWRTDIFQLWMGQGKHLIAFPVRSGELINYVGFVPSDVETVESWSAPGDPAVLASEFAGWDPAIEKLLTHVKTTFWWGLYDREPLETWTLGRLSLLGDAAHPMLPHLGQGANQSIEDAVSLAQLLADAGPDDAPNRLVEYERFRRERTTAIQLGSRASGLRYDSAYEDLKTRDAEIASSRDFRLWLYDYDVEADLKLRV